MANEQKTKKKPPAHEVIVAQLRQLAVDIESHRRVIGSERVVLLERDAAESRALITTLARMYIPEKDRRWVVDALRHFPPGFFPMEIHVFTEIEGDKGGA